MKKIISFLLVFIIAVSFVGCNKSPDATEPTGETPIQRNPMGTIQETVLYDKNGITVTATALEQTEKGCSIHVTMENTTQQPVSFAADDLIVNGITVTDGYCIEVAGGGTSSGKIDISYRSMDNAHIDNIAWIASPDARIFENIEFTTLDTASFRIETSIASDYTQLYPEQGNVIYDKNGIKIQLLGCVAGERVTNARLLVTNTTETPVALKSENPMADGKKLNAWMFDTVYAETSRYCFFEFAGTTHQTVTSELDLYSIGAERILIAELGVHTFSE